MFNVQKLTIKIKIFGTVPVLEKISIFSFFQCKTTVCSLSEEDRAEVRREPAANPEMVGPGVQSAHRPAGVQSAGQYRQQGHGRGGRGDGGGRDGGHTSWACRALSSSSVISTQGECFFADFHKIKDDIQMRLFLELFYSADNYVQSSYDTLPTGIPWISSIICYPYVTIQYPFKYCRKYLEFALKLENRQAGRQSYNANVIKNILLKP